MNLRQIGSNFYWRLRRALPEAPLRLPGSAFSEGQMRSKKWLCEEWEKAQTVSLKPLRVVHLAGWCGILPWHVWSRDRIPIQTWELWDLDPEAVKQSRQINQVWFHSGVFQSHNGDINGTQIKASLEKADVVINTSCEHLSSTAWWDSVRPGAMVILQGTDMVDPQHIQPISSSEHLASLCSPWKNVLFSGEKDFCYVDFRFKRFLLIGIKG